MATRYLENTGTCTTVPVLGVTEVNTRILGLLWTQLGSIP